MPILTLGTVSGTVFVNCILEGMTVCTPGGDIPIEQLRTGDIIFTHNGTLSTIKDISLDSIVWSDNPKNTNEILFKIPAGQLGARSDCFLSYWHRVWHKNEWRTAASLGLAKAKKHEVCSADSSIYRLYNLALESGDNFVVCGGVKVESWSGKMPRVTGGFRFSNGAPAMTVV